MVRDLDKAVSDLTATIKKNTQGSPCIDIFCCLLSEIEDKEFVSVVIADMNRFMEHSLKLFKQVDKIDDIVIASKMLTYQFIQPEQFFKKTRSYVENYNKLNNSINNLYFHDSVEEGARFFNIHSKNRLGSIGDGYSLFINTDCDEVYGLQEDIRKVCLMWNYCPAVVKAVLQTKRRALNLDANSKHFK